MKVRPSVHVIQAPSSPVIDLSSAVEYGTIRNIYPSRFQTSLDPDRAIAEMREYLQVNYKSGDYVASVGGDQASIFIAGLVLPEFTDEPINWLRWEKRRNSRGERLPDGFYTPVIIDLGE